VGNSCVSRVLPLPSAKANSLALVLVSLGGILVGHPVPEFSWSLFLH
jgi:hypothetical protein